MKTLKGWITTTVLGFVLFSFVATANGSTIVGGLTATEPCAESVKVDTQDDLGSTIVGGLTSVIVGGFTSVIVGGFTVVTLKASSDSDPTECSVIVGG